MSLMLRAYCIFILLFSTTISFGQVINQSEWKAGLAKISITPIQPMWMSGYASRSKPAEEKVHDLWAKALVLRDGTGRKCVLVTLDLVGIDRDLSQSVCTTLEKKLGLQRKDIILSTSHTHCGPVVGSNLQTMYFLDEEQSQRVRDYTAELEKKIVAVVEQADRACQPAKISSGNGYVTFATNRRNNRETSVPELRSNGQLVGPVDHQVPVLAIRSPEGKLRGVVFGYACHATTLSFMKWCGDYPGFAQLALEKEYPDAIAMFWAGCGGDQNPLPRRTVTLAEKYGKELAEGVNAVLRAPMNPVRGKFQATYTEIDLAFADLPTREQLAKDMLDGNKYIASRAKNLFETLKQKGTLAGTYPYPIQIWQLGDDVTWIALGGEVVVDYALRLKKELGQVWVSGYCNDVMAYIPSLRVLKEGGYEGATSMIYYGMPTVWSPRVEESIVAAVHASVQKLKQAK